MHRSQRQAGSIKLAIVGGGSQFVPSIVNGLAQAMQEARRPFAVEVALYDVWPEASQRMARYGAVVARAQALPLTVTACPSREEALAGAGMVLLSVSLPEEHRRYAELVRGLGIEPDEDGPGGIAEALSVAPFCLALGEDMRRLCPDALCVDLANPTDILPAIVEGNSGVRSVGLCVEVEGLRGLLAYHLGLGRDDLELDHVGINHDGWVLRMRANGRDAYPLWEVAHVALEQDPAYHPYARIGIAIYHLTGYLRTSLYHHLPYRYVRPAEEARQVARDWPAKRDLYVRAVDEALASGTPIDDPWPQHPERSRLNYPGTGRQVGRLVRALATGEPCVSALQVRNGGAIANWPPDVTVEVPVSVARGEVRPLSMGEAPEWLCGAARLGGIQRRLVAEYALARDPVLLRQAMAAIPWAAEEPALEAYARALDESYERWLAADGLV